MATQSVTEIVASILENGHPYTINHVHCEHDYIEYRKSNGYRWGKCFLNIYNVDNITVHTPNRVLKVNWFSDAKWLPVSRDRASLIRTTLRSLTD